MSPRDVEGLAQSLIRRVARTERQVRDLENKNDLGYSSIEDSGAINEYSADGTLQASFGGQTDGTSGAVVFNGPPPPTPTAPILDGGQGTLGIAWDGFFADGAARPMDFDFVRAEIANIPEMTGATYVASFVAASQQVVQMPAGTYWIRFVAESKPGRVSTPTAAVQVTVQSRVDTQAIQDEIDAAEAAIAAAKLEFETANTELTNALTGNTTALGEAQTRLQEAEAALDTAFGRLDTLDPVVAQAQADAAGAVSKAEQARIDAEAAETAAGQAAADLITAQAAATAAAGNASAAAADVVAAEAAAVAAQTRADTAAADATAARLRAEAAESSATTATGAAAAAETAADNSATEAYNALQQAIAAGGDATAAQTAATAAQGHANTAAAQATAAGTAAAQADAAAAQSAADAAQAAADAATADAAAVAASAKATTAAADAETARQRAVAAESSASTATGAAAAAEAAADTSATNAFNSLQEAQAAGNNATAAREAATTAQGHADTAAAQAAIAGTAAANADADAAAAAASAADAVADAAEAAQAATNSANSAAAAAADAETAQGLADAAHEVAEKAMRSTVKSYHRSGSDATGLSASSIPTDRGWAVADSTDSPGGKAIIKPATSNNGNFYDLDGMQDFDPTALYQVSYRVKVLQASTNPANTVIYAGVTAFGADGNPVSVSGVNTPSSSHYFAASNYTLTVADGVKTFTGYFRGYGSTTVSSENGGLHNSVLDPGKIHPAARKFCPMALLDYNSGNGIWELQSIDVAIIPPEAEKALKDAATAQARADAAHTLAGTASSTADTALGSANARTTNYKSVNLPSGLGKTDGDVWSRFSDTTWTNLIGQWVWTGGASSSGWKAYKQAHTTLGSVDIATLSVIGQATFSDLVAEHVAGRTASFLSLAVTQLTAGTGNMAVGVIDKIYSEVVLSRKLYANQVIIARGANLVVNPGLEDNAAGWTGADPGVVEFSATGGYSGGGSYTVVAPTAGQRGAYVGLSDVNYRTRIEPGQYYRLSAWVKSTAQIEVNHASLYLRCYAPEATTYTFAIGSPARPEKPIPANTWGKIQGIVKIPDAGGLTQGTIGGFRETAHGAQQVTFSDFSLFAAADGSLIVEDSITAPKIVASEELTAKFAQFLSVTAGMVDTNSLWTDESFLGKARAQVLTLGSIKPEMMNHGVGQNRVKDPMFLDPDIRAHRLAQSSGAQWITWSTRYPATNYALRIMDSTANQNAIWTASPVPYDDLVPVTPGQRVHFRIDAQGSSAVEWRFVFRARTASGTNTFRALPGSTYYPGNNGITEETWTVDSDVVAIQMGTQTKGKTTPGTGWVEFHNPYWSEVMSSVSNAGQTTEVSPQGIRMTDADGSLAVQLGTWDDDRFAVYKAGEEMAAMSSEGAIAGRSLTVRDSLYYRGEEFSDYMEDYPRGVDSSHFYTSEASYAPTNIGSSWMRVSGLSFVAKAGRNYKVHFNGLHVYPAQAGIRASLKMCYQIGSQPSSSNLPTDSQVMYLPIAGAVFTTPSLTTMGTFSATDADVYVTVFIRASAGGTLSYSWFHGDPNFQKPIRMWVEDLGVDVPESGTAFIESGTSSPATPPPVKTTRTVEWGYTGVRSYTGSNATYAFNTSKGYQGLSPAGQGNLKSIWTLNDASIRSALSGATIHDIWAYFYFEHWWANAGGTAQIRLHAHSGLPSTYSATTNGVNSGNWPRAAGRWVRLPSSLYEGFRTGAYRGLALEGDGGYGTYGIANNARLKIKYTK